MKTDEDDGQVQRMDEKMNMAYMPDTARLKNRGRAINHRLV